MRINSLILFAVFSLFLFSCDDGIKFDNPLDQNADISDSSDSQNDENKDQTDSVADEDPNEQTDTENPDKKQGELDGECYPNKTCNDGLICDKDNNICIKDSESSENNDDSDNSMHDDADSTDIEQNDNDAQPVQTNQCDTNPCNNVANSTGICTVSGSNYICGCKSDYTWNGSECQTQTPLGNICTGQNTCYDNSAYITCPTSSSKDFFGQDAYYASLGKCVPQSFTIQTISSQKVILDNNTGLIWQQTISTDKYQWDDAVSYCNGLSYAGYSDWRLPTPQELLTIVDNSKEYPAIDETYFPNTPAYLGYFWSSTTVNYTNSPDSAWCVGFREGNVINNFSKTASIYVRCVRGNELPMSSFSTSTINGDVIVTDTKTGLVWQKTYQNGKTWQQALKYCEDSTYAGYSDWRLPNKNELASLVNYKKYNPASDFPDMPSQGFWSSSTWGNGNDDWIVFFKDGVIGDNDKKITSYYIRCVR